MVETQIVGGNKPEDDYQWWESAQIIRCCGCRTISFRLSATSEDDFDYENNEQIYSEKLYPERSSGSRKAMANADKLPPKILRIYSETLRAINGGLVVLAAGGLRTLIEAVCKDQKVCGNNLESLIDELAVKGILGKKQADSLHSHRWLGNFALHEAETPKPQELAVAMEIAEIILRTIYVVPHLHTELEAWKNFRTSKPVTPPPSSPTTAPSPATPAAASTTP